MSLELPGLPWPVRQPRSEWMARSLSTLFLLVGLSETGVRAGELLVAAASDLVFCLEEVDAAYTRKHPEHKLKLTTGSSGNFFAQIRNGAPYDIFFSADMRYPDELIQAGHAERSSLIQYGNGRIVLWSMNTNFDVGRGLEWLRDGRVKRIAMANPEHAPYGRAARAALQYEKLWSVVQPKLVLGENVAQAAQFVQTGNADAGIVALSLVLAPKLAGQGHFFEIPEKAHPALEQGALLTKRGARNPAAVSYFQFTASPEARVIFERFGFNLPRKAK